MKIDRRLKEYRTTIEELCTKFNLKIPLRVELMKNWSNRPEVSWGKITINHSTNDYTIKIRKSRMVESKPFERSVEEIKKSICHELAHTLYHEHNAKHMAFTNEMYNSVKGE